MAGGALLLLLSSGAIGLASLRVTRAEMQRTFETRIGSVLEITAQRIGPHVLAGATGGSSDEVARAVKAPVRTDGVLFCACFSREGKLVGFSAVPEFDEPLAPRLDELGPARASRLHLRTRRGEEVKLLSAPVLARAGGDAVVERTAADGGAREAGVMLLGYTTAPVDAEFAPVKRRVGSIVVAVGALAALLAWRFARSLVEPIHELLAGTERVARGDFEHRVRVRTRDELELLAESFNAMTAELAESRDRLARQQLALEAAVAERTHELTRACADLQVLDKMKDGFLSSISHELRTPITSIRAFAEILQLDPAMEPATRQEFAGIILKESDHLSHLVGDVLDLVTIESGEVPFRFARHPPAELARAAAAQVEPMAREKAVDVEVAAAPGLPEVLWDGAKITRLLLELLDNAVRFSPGGGRVFVSVARAGELVRIEVRDEGPGIPPDGLESVFDRFHQAGTVLTGKPRGQGVGLPICRLIAERHEGCVRATASTHGAHLVVDLPVAPSGAAPSPAPDPDATPAKS